MHLLHVGLVILVKHLLLHWFQACIPKATVLDLSCNLLTTLPVSNYQSLYGFNYNILNIAIIIAFIYHNL